MNLLMEKAIANTTTGIFTFGDVLYMAKHLGLLSFREARDNLR